MVDYVTGHPLTSNHLGVNLALFKIFINKNDFTLDLQTLFYPHLLDLLLAYCLIINTIIFKMAVTWGGGNQAN